MTLPKIVESKYSQHLFKAWQKEANIFEAYSEYRSGFTNMLTQFSFIWNGHLNRICIARRRIKLLPNSDPAHLVASPYESSDALRLREFHLIILSSGLKQNGQHQLSSGQKSSNPFASPITIKSSEI